MVVLSAQPKHIIMVKSRANLTNPSQCFYLSLCPNTSRLLLLVVIQPMGARHVGKTSKGALLWLASQRTKAISHFISNCVTA